MVTFWTYAGESITTLNQISRNKIKHTNTFCYDTIHFVYYGKKIENILAYHLHFSVSWIVVEPYSCHKDTPFLGTDKDK